MATITGAPQQPVEPPSSSATLSPKVTPGLLESMANLGARNAVTMIPEGEPYPLSQTITGGGLRHFLESMG